MPVDLSEMYIDCNRTLFLSLSPVSSYSFRRNELASPDSPNSTSSGSVVSPGSASIPTARRALANFVTHREPSTAESNNIGNVKYRTHEQRLNLSNNSFLHDYRSDALIGKEAVSRLSFVPSNSFPSNSPFKPVLSKTDCIVPTATEKETHQVPSRENVPVHKPIPFLPVITQYPTVLGPLHVRNNETSVKNTNNEVNDVGKLPKTGNHTTAKEPTGMLLPAIGPVSSQTPHHNQVN